MNIDREKGRHSAAFPNLSQQFSRGGKQRTARLAKRAWRLVNLRLLLFQQPTSAVSRCSPPTLLG
jgi:hypothetical protein